MKCELCGSEIEEQYAYTAIIFKGPYRTHTQFPYGIGKAVVGTLGYFPVPERGYFETYEAAQEEARKLNQNMGLTPEKAYLIILGTMRRM